MVEVAICDDQEYAHNSVEKLIKEYEKNVEINLTHYYSAKEVLKNADSFDILLLDIEMPEMDGIELAERLNNTRNDYRIIMLTAKGERYKEAFKINAYRFVTKPIHKEEFFEALDDAVRYYKGLDVIELTNNGKNVIVEQRKIYYIESCGDYLKVYTRNKEYTKHVSAHVMLGLLDDNIFVQCHKSYIVNLLHVKELQDMEFVMERREVIKEVKVPIAFRRRKEISLKYARFDSFER